MSDATNYLDNFFGNPKRQINKLTIIKQPMSNCCGAKVTGELFRNFGRCSDCLEMAEFSE